MAAAHTKFRCHRFLGMRPSQKQRESPDEQATDIHSGTTGRAELGWGIPKYPTICPTTLENLFKGRQPRAQQAWHAWATRPRQGIVEAYRYRYRYMFLGGCKQVTQV